MSGTTRTQLYSYPSEFRIEFPIPSDSVRFIRDLYYIQKLFEVTVDVSGAQSSRGKSWVALRGKQENTAKAKKYILALCAPEVKVEPPLPPHLIQPLFGEHSRMRRELEREFQAVITCSAEGIIVIRGAEKDVFSAVEKLQSSIGPLYPPSIVTATPNDLSTIARDGPQRLSHTKHPDLNTPRGNPILSRGSGDSSRENRIQYFVNLGYPRERVETVLCSLADAPDDVVLSRLVQYAIPQRTVNESLPEPSPSRPVDPELLRHIVIDGSNVAMRHGNGRVFSCRGIQLAVDYFKRRGHNKITVFVPEWRKEASTPDNPITDQHILYTLEQNGHLKYTPSRRVEGHRIVCYDDRFIVKLATKEQGVIVSNDQFRDLVKEKHEWKQVIETRLLQFTFANDYFMPPDDPLGRNGPTLDQLLSTDPHGVSQPVKEIVTEGGRLQPCKYGDRCTFGRKCKFWHPEREPLSSNGSTASHTPSTSRSPTPSPSPDKRLNSSRSREDLVRSGGYHDNPSSHTLSLSELTDSMANMTLPLASRPESINLSQYPVSVARSTPSLPTPQEPTWNQMYDTRHQERRPLSHTAPVVTHHPPHTGFNHRPYTEDLSRHAYTPSHPHRVFAQDSEYHYDQRVRASLPGPYQQARDYYGGGLLPRDTPASSLHPTHYHETDRYQVSPQQHYAHTTHSYMPSQPHRSHVSNEHMLSNRQKLYQQALSVLPGCEDRLRRVFSCYREISSLDEAIQLAQTID